MKLKLSKVIEYEYYISYFYNNFSIQKRDYGNGTIRWLKFNGSFFQLHKEDGLAGFNDYYLFGKRYNKKEFAELTNHIMCVSCNDFCKQNCFN